MSIYGAHHDCDYEDCDECPICDVCGWCENCTDCDECECPSDEADELLSWLENRRNVCKNCFRVARPIDVEEGYVEDDRSHVYEEKFHEECGCGQLGTPAAVERMWGAYERVTLPTEGDGMTFEAVRDRVLDLLEQVGVEVDRGAAEDVSDSRKADDLWQSRDRDCLLFALDAGVEFDEVDRGELERVSL